MTSITNSLPQTTISSNSSLASPLIASNGDTADTTNLDSFGPAVNLSLSPPAQAVVDKSGSTESVVTRNPVATGTNESSPSSPAIGSATAPASGAGGGAGSSSNATDALIKASERKAALLVGIADAPSVVDKLGNIDHVAVTKILAQQAAKQNA